MTFMEYGKEEDTLIQDQKATVKNDLTYNEEGRFGTFNTHKNY